MLVQPDVKTDIFSVHLLLGELANLFDGPGRPLLEGHAIQPLVHVDGVFARHHLVNGRLALLFTFNSRHLERIRGIIKTNVGEAEGISLRECGLNDITYIAKFKFITSAHLIVQGKLGFQRKWKGLR